jgi:hypothetical protein
MNIHDCQYRQDDYNLLKVQVEDLQQAIESFVIASATGSHNDKVRTYIHMLKVANLYEYLPNKE